MDIFRGLREHARSMALGVDASNFNGNDRLHPKGVLGRGAMGVVYRVEDLELGMDVALKTLSVPDPEEQYRLKQEFRGLSGIEHPNLIDLYELFTAGDQCFFTMELIEGRDLAAFMAEGGLRFSEPWQERLRAALRQMATGLEALHASGRMHCDLKPSNVMVALDGRLVLLDFGLARTLTPDPMRRADAGEMAGTIAYLAPDELFGAPRGPASDWYSVGAILFELCSGNTPFGGEEPGPMLYRRGSERPPRLAALASGVPGWIDALAAALLSADPKARLDAAGVRAALGDARGAGTSVIGSRREGGSFVGRMLELTALRGALDATASGRPGIVSVSGTSGIGKSELVRAFARQAAEAGAIVLQSRCHPQESVPFKALDGAVDDLSAHLLDLSPSWAVPALPHGDALLRLFPVLRRVPELTGSPVLEPPADDATVRRWGVTAFRVLLARIASARPVVLWIDDLQWGDLDSLTVLRMLLREPDAPRVLLVLSYRSEELATARALIALREGPWELPAGSLHDIALGPLSADEARALCAKILPGVAKERATSIASEAAGSPFFVGELSRAADGDIEPPSRSVAAVVSRRVGLLSPKARRVLETVSVAAGPLSPNLLLRASGLSHSARPLLTTLERACLVKTAPRGEGRTVDAYHDRIREAVVARLTPDDLKGRHRVLAGVLKQEPDPDPETLFVHTLGAGELIEASGWASTAAGRAEAMLAFDRAAGLYRRALDLGALDRARLLERLGGCLINAGRGAEAPPCFTEAASLRVGDPIAAHVLRRSAAEQLMRNGRMDEATSLAREVLAEVGVELPRSTRAAALRTALGMARLFVRGTSFRARPAQDILPAVVQRLDTLWGIGCSLAMTDPPSASALTVQHLLEAADAGHPWHLALSLCYEAVLESAIGGPFLHRRAARLLDRGAEIAATVDDAAVKGMAISTRGMAAWQAGRFAEALLCCDRGIAFYETECRGTTWHRAATENYALSALAFLGDMRALEARRREALRRAEDRGDLFGAAVFRMGQLGVARLATDEPELAIADADAVTARWPLRLYHHTVITAQAELYRGDAAAARARVERAWTELGQNRILGLEFPRIELLHLRARAELAGASARPDARAGVRHARGWAKTIARSNLPPAAPFADSIRASASWIEGDTKAAVAFCAEAASGYDAASMALYASAMRLALATLDAKHASVGARAWAKMRALGVTRPAQMAKMLLGGLPLAEELLERAAKELERDASALREGRSEGTEAA